MTSPAGPRIEVPDALVSWHRKFFGEAGRAWIDAAPDLAAGLLDRWRLRLDGAATCGAVALVLPVRRADGMPAVLKLQPGYGGQGIGEPEALRTRGTETAPCGCWITSPHRVRCCSSGSTPNAHWRLSAMTWPHFGSCPSSSPGSARVPAPEGVRRLSEFGADLLERVPRALTLVRDPSQHRLIRTCASALEEVLPEAGDRLLHCDLHYYNILAPHPADPREPWLAIDPEPLTGDPGFALLAALHNRWEEAVATGDLPRAIRRRFDLMTDILGLDRKRATRWTLARILQYALWDVEHDDTIWHTEPDRAIAQILLDSAG